MPKKPGTSKLLIWVLLFLFGLTVFVYLKPKKVDDYSVEITYPSGKSVHSLTKNQIISVDGFEGKVVIEIQNQRVKVLSSSCQNKICIKAGQIHVPGPVIICAPNRVMVRIIKNRSKPLVTY